MNTQKGIALITTLLIISILLTVVIEFNRIALADIEVSKNFGDEKKIIFLAISGLNAIKEYLGIEGLYTRSDNLTEDWANSRTYFKTATSMLDEGTLEGNITDENGKIDVNSLLNDEGQFDETQKALWERLLVQPRFNLTEEEVATIINSMKDWLDPDDEISGIYGAETGYYRQKGYQCKNNLLDTLEEMLLINGMTEDIYYGDQFRTGINHYFTVYGGSKININTAPLPVLMALSDNISEDIALEMDQYRRDVTNKSLLSDMNWYKKIYQFENPLPENIIGTKSDFFTVFLKGALGDSTKKIKAVIFRSKTASRIIYWQEI